MTVLTALSLALAGCAGGAGDHEPRQASPSTTAIGTRNTPAGTTALGGVREIATGLEAPWSIVFVDGTALVSERDSGRILEIAQDGSVRTVHTLSDIVRPESGGGMGPEGGLLGMDVDDERRLYVYST
ncbi:hypothetical protein [Microbacterium sp. NPDC056569]|uniref:hypothetical protein n=1 Tax=Microbacterium sp. NPDC056569 TaxID=3345867 RepID=UPI00366B4F40